MKINEDDVRAMATIVLWAHRDDECDLAIQYRGDGEHWRYEMRDGDQIYPIHPDFPVGFVLAAACLQYICQDLYAGRLVESAVLSSEASEAKDLLKGWEYRADDQST